MNNETFKRTAGYSAVIAVAIAIFKYRLYDIDLIINKTLVFGTLTVIVAIVYALVVGGLSLVFQPVATGSSP